jgi:hypothetical protein
VEQNYYYDDVWRAGGVLRHLCFAPCSCSLLLLHLQHDFGNHRWSGSRPSPKAGRRRTSGGGVVLRVGTTGSRRRLRCRLHVDGGRIDGFLHLLFSPLDESFGREGKEHVEGTLARHVASQREVGTIGRIRIAVGCAGGTKFATVASIFVDSHDETFITRAVAFDAHIKTQVVLLLYLELRCAGCPVKKRVEEKVMYVIAHVRNDWFRRIVGTHHEGRTRTFLVRHGAHFKRRIGGNRVADESVGDGDISLRSDEEVL